MTAAGASAALPELGRCEAVPPGTGEYELASCTGGAKPTGGNFDWHPGAVKNKFSSVSGAATLETKGGSQITCKSILQLGEYVSSQREIDTMRMFGCQLVALGGHCQNANPEEIVTPPLEGRLGFIKGGAKPAVGLDLLPLEGPRVVEFKCDTPAGGLVPVVVLGSVIAKISPLEKMTATSKRTYAESKGKQAPTHLEGAPPDVLTLLIGANPPEESGLKAALMTSNEEKLEVKAIL
jgi:hypothetical protein